MTDLKNTAETEEKYQNLFKMNEKANGGSFYLQSKVKRNFFFITLMLLLESIPNEFNFRKKFHF